MRVTFSNLPQPQQLTRKSTMVRTAIKRKSESKYYLHATNFINFNFISIETRRINTLKVRCLLASCAELSSPFHHRPHPKPLSAMMSSYKMLLSQQNTSRRARASRSLHRKRRLTTRTMRILDGRKARRSLRWWSSRVRKSKRRIRRIRGIWRSLRSASMIRRES